MSPSAALTMHALELTARNLAARWELTGQHARFTCGDLQGAVDVTAPTRGLSQLAYRGTPLDAQVLGVEAYTAPSDAYVRGSDLVVAYRETDERPFSVQVYWSIADQRDSTSFLLDATISIQTRQWEAYPEVSVSSSIAGALPTAEGEGLMRVRLKDAPWSYAEFAPAIDFAQGALLGGPGGPTLWRFGDQFMERGVIRRLRVRGALLFRKTDAAEAASLRDAFLVEQPPLTA